MIFYGASKIFILLILGRTYAKIVHQKLESVLLPKYLASSKTCAKLSCFHHLDIILCLPSKTLLSEQESDTILAFKSKFSFEFLI